MLELRFWKRRKEAGRFLLLLRLPAAGVRCSRRRGRTRRLVRIVPEGAPSKACSGSCTCIAWLLSCVATAQLQDRQGKDNRVRVRLHHDLPVPRCDGRRWEGQDREERQRGRSLRTIPLLLDPIAVHADPLQSTDSARSHASILSSLAILALK